VLVPLDPRFRGGDGKNSMPTHAEQRILPYTPEQLFALVADIERYPEFLPWCVGARIRERKPDLIVADLIIGFRMFRGRFTSRVALDPPRRIDVTYTEGPFRYLNNHWVFDKVAGGCRLDFFVDFEFKSRILQRVIELLFHEAVRRMVGAFEHRAQQLYGTPAREGAGKAAV
jgi:coenzyme Q-binding protein COQ10